MIDVIICTYNPNQEFLKRTVEAIVNQTLDKTLWQLTVVDNNSSTSVGDIDFIKEWGISVVYEKKPGLAHARECGIKSAKGDVLVFVDDDNILDAEYLYWANEAFKNKELGILSGAIFPEYLSPIPDWYLPYEGLLAIRRIEGDEVQFNKLTVCNSLFPIGAGMVIRKKLIEDYYSSHINGGNLIEGRKGNELSSGEDTDLDFYALHKGYKIGLYPKMKLVHIIPPGRLTMPYLLKLTSSILKCSFDVNKKWAPVFKHNVFEEFDFKKSKIVYKMIVNKIGGFFDKKRKIYNNVFYTLYKLKQ